MINGGCASRKGDKNLSWLPRCAEDSRNPSERSARMHSRRLKSYSPITDIREIGSGVRESGRFAAGNGTDAGELNCGKHDVGVASRNIEIGKDGIVEHLEKFFGISSFGDKSGELFGGEHHPSVRSEFKLKFYGVRNAIGALQRFRVFGRIEQTIERRGNMLHRDCVTFFYGNEIYEAGCFLTARR